MKVEIKQYLNQPFSLAASGESSISGQSVLAPATIDTDRVRVLDEGFGTIRFTNAHEYQTTAQYMAKVRDELKISGRNFHQFESLMLRNKVHIDCNAIMGAKPWSFFGKPLTTLTLDDNSKVRIRGHYDLRLPKAAGHPARLVRCGLGE